MGGLDEAEVSVVWIKGRDEINNRNQKLSPCTVENPFGVLFIIWGSRDVIMTLFYLIHDM